MMCLEKFPSLDRGFWEKFRSSYKDVDPKQVLYESDLKIAFGAICVDSYRCTTSYRYAGIYYAEFEFVLENTTVNLAQLGKKFLIALQAHFEKSRGCRIYLFISYLSENKLILGIANSDFGYDTLVLLQQEQEKLFDQRKRESLELKRKKAEKVRSFRTK